MKDYIEQLVALSEFANGTSFEIVQINPKGACRITSFNDKKTSYSGSIVNAWKNVRYQAGITHRYENTTSWPSRAYFEHGAELTSVRRRKQ